jgi:hypothetical protein
VASGHPSTSELEVNLLAEVRDRGASTARDLDDGLPRPRSTVELVEHPPGPRLLHDRQLGTAGRNSQFEILYDLPGRVLPTGFCHADAGPGRRRP